MKTTLILILTLSTLVQAEDGKISGLVFYDFTSNFVEDADISNEFGLKRVYFTFEKELSEGIVYKFQTDIDYSNAPKNIYLKNAKVDWSTSAGKLIFGLQGLNVYNIQEKTWGYRFIEKSAMDKHKFASSADIGIGYSNKIANNIHLHAIYSNGTGYKKVEDDSYKKLSVQALFGEKNLSKKDGFYFGGVFSFEPYDYEIDSVNVKKESKTVIGLFGGIAGSGIRIGGEFDQFNDQGSQKKKQILSAYANYKLSSNSQIFGRVDLYDPDTNAEKDADNYFIAGVIYSPGKGLIIAPNIKRVIPESGEGTTMYSVNFQFKF